MNSREKFERWLLDGNQTTRYWLDKYWDHNLEKYQHMHFQGEWEVWQAACQYKDEQWQELDSILRPGNPETPRVGDMKLALEALLREHKAYTEHIELLEDRITELEAQHVRQFPSEYYEAIKADVDAQVMTGDEIDEMVSKYAPRSGDIDIALQNMGLRIQELEAQRVPEWHPIETAPKDGTAFVGTDGKYAYRTKRGAYYEKFPHHEGGPTYSYKWNKEDDHSVCPWRPTHWMPLPAPPAPAGDE